MQNSTIIWLMRHGETDRTLTGRFNGRDDVILNAVGRRQCEQLAAQLIAVPLDAAITSPLSRAIETAQIISSTRALTIDRDPRFTEIDYGEWEGLTYQEVQEGWPVRFKEWETDPAQYAPPDGETGIAVAERARTALRDLVIRCQGRSVLLVAHKTVNRLLLCTLLNIDLSRYRQSIPQPPCALARLEYIGDERVLVTLPGQGHPQVAASLHN